jgi:hypothetical protein
MPREKQIEFPSNQTQVAWLTPALLLASIACIVLVAVLLLVLDDGPFIGPW